jgi:AcrR family transcriptional regulator
LIDMAKPKSEERRNALLEAAIRIFAKQGLSAPTSAISREAGVAEGTLFTYFPTKEALVGAIYVGLKQDLGNTLLAGFPRKKGVVDRFRHMWNHYVDWGAAHPEAARVLREIDVRGSLGVEAQAVDAQGAAFFGELARAAREQHVIRKELSDAYLWAAINALSAMTIELMIRDPENAPRYRSEGFRLLRSGASQPGRGRAR